MIITDTSFSLRLSLPDYKRINPGNFEEPITDGGELYKWAAERQDALYKDGKPYIEESGYVNIDNSVIATTQEFTRSSTSSMGQITFKFADGSEPVTISIPKGNTESEILNYSINGFYAKTQPYFVALICKQYRDPPDLNMEISAQIYWWEDILLICNYKTGEYGVAGGLNGIGNLDHVTFSSSEKECILQTDEIDQFKVKTQNKRNLRHYTFAYKVNIEEFIKNNKNGGFVK